MSSTKKPEKTWRTAVTLASAKLDWRERLNVSASAHYCWQSLSVRKLTQIRRDWFRLIWQDRYLWLACYAVREGGVKLHVSAAMMMTHCASITATEISRKDKWLSPPSAGFYYRFHSGTHGEVDSYTHTHRLGRFLKRSSKGVKSHSDTSKSGGARLEFWWRVRKIAFPGRRQHFV